MGQSFLHTELSRSYKTTHQQRQHEAEARDSNPGATHPPFLSCPVSPTSRLRDLGASSNSSPNLFLPLCSSHSCVVIKGG